MRSRRCSCAPVKLSGQANRNQMSCSPMNMPPQQSREYLRSRDWTNKDYLDPPDVELTEVYGSGISQNEKQAMKDFDNAVAMTSLPFPPRGRNLTVDDIPCDPLNSMRYGKPWSHNNWNRMVKIQK
jgi:hypothetical protein